MYRLVIVPLFFALVAAAPAGHHIPGISTNLVGPAVGHVQAPVQVAAVRTYQAPAVVSAPAVTHVQAPVQVAAVRTYQAPAVVSAPAVSAVQVPAVVAAPVTKTVHYANTPVVTGYSTQIYKPSVGALATPLNVVSQQQVVAPARTVARITPQVTQVQPEYHVQRVAVDVPVAQPVAVPTPVVNQVEVRASPAVVSAPAISSYAVQSVVPSYGVSSYAAQSYAVPSYAVQSYAVPSSAVVSGPAVTSYGVQSVVPSSAVVSNVVSPSVVNSVVV